MTSSLGKGIHVCAKIFFTGIFCITIILALVSFNSFYPFTDPIHDVQFLDKLSLLLGVHEQSAVVVLDLDLWSSTAFTYVFQRQISDGSFLIASESHRRRLPGLFSPAVAAAAAAAGVDAAAAAAEPAARAANTRPHTTVLAAGLNVSEDAAFAARVNDLVSDAARDFPIGVDRRRAPVIAKLSPELVAGVSSVELDVRLRHLDHLLNISPFNYQRDLSIGTLSRAEQTVLQWFSINLLAHKFKDWEVDSSAVILDLREETLLVTFAAGSSLKLPDDSSVVHVKKLSAFAHLIKIVTIEIAHLGLLTARRDILEASGHEATGGEADDLRSCCVNPIADATWAWKNRTVRVRGLENGDKEMVKEKNGPFAGKKVSHPVANYERCHTFSATFLRKALAAHATAQLVRKAILGRPVFMEGLLMEKCFERGLSLPYGGGGDVKMKSFLESLKHACKKPNMDQPLACVDLMYLATLMDQFLSFKQGSVLHSWQDVGGRSGNWHLAVALYVYQNGL